MKTTEVKEFMSRAETLMREMEEKRLEMADLKKEMKDSGINVKAALNVIKIKLADRGKEEGEYIADVAMYAECAGVQLGFTLSEEDRPAEAQAHKKAPKDARVSVSKLAVTDVEEEEEDVPLPFDEKTMAINAQLTDIPESLRRV